MPQASVLTIALILGTARPVPVQPAPSTRPALPITTQRSEAEFLVPPQGGAFEVPVHAGEVCILSFAEHLSNKALASSPDFEIRSWGDDGIAIRATGAAAQATTLAVATSSGAVKVNVTLTVVGSDEPAYTLVRFKAVSAEEAFEAQVNTEVAKRLAPIETELVTLRQNIDAQIRERADRMIAERILKRNESTKLTSHERNDDHVIVHVTHALLLGDDGYLAFEIENRSSGPFRLASVRVTAGSLDISGPSQLATQAADRDPRVIGVVAAGATIRGVVVVRSVNQILGKNLVVTVTGPGGAGAIRLDRGVVLR